MLVEACGHDLGKLEPLRAFIMGELLITCPYDSHENSHFEGVPF